MSMQQQLLSLAQRTINAGFFIRSNLVPARYGKMAAYGCVGE
jgi:hypothetical protein